MAIYQAVYHIKDTEKRTVSALRRQKISLPDFIKENFIAQAESVLEGEFSADVVVVSVFDPDMKKAFEERTEEELAAALEFEEEGGPAPTTLLPPTTAEINKAGKEQLLEMVKAYDLAETLGINDSMQPKAIRESLIKHFGDDTDDNGNSGGNG